MVQVALIDQRERTISRRGFMARNPCAQRYSAYMRRSSVPAWTENYRWDCWHRTPTYVRDGRVSTQVIVGLRRETNDGAPALGLALGIQKNGGDRFKLAA